MVGWRHGGGLFVVLFELPARESNGMVDENGKVRRLRFSTCLDVCLRAAFPGHNGGFMYLCSLVLELERGEEMDLPSRFGAVTIPIRAGPRTVVVATVTRRLYTSGIALYAMAIFFRRARNMRI